MPLPQVLKGCLSSAKSWERERALRLCVRVLGTCKERPWQLLLCSSCAAEGTHRCCSQLEDSTAQWECHGCAGPSNASSAALQEAGPSTPRQPTQASSRASEAGEGCSSPSGPMRLRDRHACQLCRQPNAGENICVLWQQHRDICFHACCVYFASSLTPVAFSGYIAAFHLSAIRRAIQLSAEKLCFVCGVSGASITCQESGCERSFHLPCATRGRCVTQYFEQYRAFCSRHRPQQAVLRDPDPDTDCLLCLEDVGDRQSYRTMVCPVCQHAWFHRDCIQGHALQAGISAFRCLLCRDKDQFQQEMLRMGIRIPRRPPEWETAQEFEDLMERHSQCDAQHCLCPGGPGSCCCAAPVLLRAPTGAAPSWRTARPSGSAMDVLAPATPPVPPCRRLVPAPPGSPLRHPPVPLRLVRAAPALLGPCGCGIAAACSAVPRIPTAAQADAPPLPARSSLLPAQPASCPRSLPPPPQAWRAAAAKAALGPSGCGKGPARAAGHKHLTGGPATAAGGGDIASRVLETCGTRAEPGEATSGQEEHRLLAGCCRNLSSSPSMEQVTRGRKRATAAKNVQRGGPRPAAGLPDGMAGGSVQGLPGHFLAGSVALPWLLSPKARPPQWETAQEFAALMERHSQCDAQHCLCPGGRGQAEEEGPWQLLLCSSCAAEGTHRCCSQLEDSTAQWECHGCAGPSNVLCQQPDSGGIQWIHHSLSPLCHQTCHPAVSREGPSAPATAHGRQYRRTLTLTLTACSAWRMWGTDSPTEPWCAPCSTGTASRAMLSRLAPLHFGACSAGTKTSSSRKC
ncbi:uncharacterized protein [Melanerpes formicivorus]|uniref:uncharacterized protein n=1 Tax=Melanerpes formicivorus TaxID=211600 RepID=UPI00358E8E52